MATRNATHRENMTIYADSLIIRETLKPGEKYTAGEIAAGMIDWPGTSVEVTHRVSDALSLLERWQVVATGWSESARVYFWWLQ